MFSTYQWNDCFWGYQLKAREDGSGIYDIAGIELKSLDNNESITIFDTEIPQVYCFLEDYLYYMSEESVFGIYNLKTGENKMIPLYTETGSVDFTVVKDKIYLNSLYLIDRNNDMQSFIQSNDGLSIKELYTDGEQLYGICGPRTSDYGVMKRIVLKETSESAKQLTGIQGTIYELDRYSFHTEPMQGGERNE